MVPATVTFLLAGEPGLEVRYTPVIIIPALTSLSQVTCSPRKITDNTMVNTGTRFTKMEVLGAPIFWMAVPPAKQSKVRINTVFSQANIIIDPDTPVLIKSNSAFAVTGMPDSSSINFGSHKYATKGFKPEGDYLEIELKVAFGKVKVTEAKVK